MKVKSTIVIFDGNSPLRGRRALEEFVLRASQISGLRARPSVLITGNRQMRQLNARFRRNDSATDVLSFPPAGANSNSAGDIAISFEIATQNALLLGHSVEDEIRILMLHGILHLAGYDHENDRGEMREKEAALRKKLGLPTGLIERSLTENDSSSTKRHRLAAVSVGHDNSSQRRTTNGQRRKRT